MRKIFLLISIIILGASLFLHHSFAQVPTNRLEFLGTLPAPTMNVHKMFFTGTPDCSNSDNDNAVYFNTTTMSFEMCQAGVDEPAVVSVFVQVADDIYLVDDTSPANLKVGIGAYPPNLDLKLTLDNEGGIVAKGTYDPADTSLPDLQTTGAGTRMIWYPKKSAFRAGRVDGNQWDDANVGDDSVAFGHNNVASAIKATVSGGRDNSVLTKRGAIGGGESNTVSSTGVEGAGTIAGGAGNTVSADFAVVTGGWGNTATALSTVVGGGNLNDATAQYATISGGYDNNVSGNHSVIGGGELNEVFAKHTTIGGGQSNKVIDPLSVNSTIAGGTANQILGQSVASTIGGGFGNEINNVAQAATIAGGVTNRADGEASTVGGGMNNHASGNGSTVSGGQANQATGLFATVPGGVANYAYSNYSFAAGQNMQLTDTANNTFIWGHSGTPVPVNTADAFIIYSGNVGIGTTLPQEKLHVNGVAKVETMLNLTPQTNEPAICDAANPDNKGAIYVDEAPNVTFCLCDGSQWQNIWGAGDCT